MIDKDKIEPPDAWIDGKAEDAGRKLIKGLWACRIEDMLRSFEAGGSFRRKISEREDVIGNALPSRIPIASCFSEASEIVDELFGAVVRHLASEDALPSFGRLTQIKRP